MSKQSGASGTLGGGSSGGGSSSGGSGGGIGGGKGGKGDCLLFNAISCVLLAFRKFADAPGGAGGMGVGAGSGHTSNAAQILADPEFRKSCLGLIQVRYSCFGHSSPSILFRSLPSY